MSAQLQKSARTAFDGNDMYVGEPAEYEEAGRTYIAYSGRFFVDEESGTVSRPTEPARQGVPASVEREYQCRECGPAIFDRAFKYLYRVAESVILSSRPA